MGTSDISRDEFTAATDRLHESIREGFTGLHLRLDTLNGRTRVAETKIAILEDRAESAKDTKRNWDGIIGGGIVALIAGAIEWFTKHR